MDLQIVLDGGGGGRYGKEGDHSIVMQILTVVWLEEGREVGTLSKKMDIWMNLWKKVLMYAGTDFSHTV